MRSQGNVELTQLLLDAGAAVDARAQGAVTPLHVAAETGRTDVVSLLLQVHTEALLCAPLHALQHLHSALARSAVVGEDHGGAVYGRRRQKKMQPHTSTSYAQQCCCEPSALTGCRRALTPMQRTRRAHAQ